MRNLTANELILYNGGQVPPTVSSDPNVQYGYNIGFRIGRAVGSTISQCGIIFRELKSWL